MTKKLAALVGGVILAAGCATPEVTLQDMDDVRSAIQTAQNAANDAQRVANEARQLAQGAQSTANQALSAAQDAQACCDATNQRIDRMIEEGVAK